MIDGIRKIKRIELKLRFVCDGWIAHTSSEHKDVCGRTNYVEYVGYLPLIVEGPQCHSRHRISELEIRLQ